LKHPYIEYESHPLWKIVENAIEDLVKNDDLVEKTGREYIVGYICEQILKNVNE
jgi:hypothetical protein